RISTMRLWPRKRREEDLERELRSHLELETDEQHQAGLSPEQSRLSALRNFATWHSPRKTCAPHGAGCSWSRLSPTSVTASAPCGAAPRSPPSRSSRWHSASEQTPPSSAWWTPCCCELFLWIGLKSWNV